MSKIQPLLWQKLLWFKTPFAPMLLSFWVGPFAFVPSICSPHLANKGSQVASFLCLQPSIGSLHLAEDVAPKLGSSFLKKAGKAFTLHHHHHFLECSITAVCKFPPSPLSGLYPNVAFSEIGIITPNSKFLRKMTVLVLSSNGLNGGPQN